MYFSCLLAIFFCIWYKYSLLMPLIRIRCTIQSWKSIGRIMSRIGINGNGYTNYGEPNINYADPMLAMEYIYIYIYLYIYIWALESRLLWIKYTLFRCIRNTGECLPTSLRGLLRVTRISDLRSLLVVPIRKLWKMQIMSSKINRWTAKRW